MGILPIIFLNGDEMLIVLDRLRIDILKIIFGIYTRCQQIDFF